MWKEIDGFDGKYKINNNGDIYSNVTNIYLKRQLNKKGYPIVRITCNGIKTTLVIHRVVALLFIPNPHNKATVNHKNGIKHDNRAENLEWCTYRENMQHAFNVLCRKGSWTGKFGKENCHSKSVEQYSLSGSLIATYESIDDAEFKTGISSIGTSCKSDNLFAGGYNWRFADSEKKIINVLSKTRNKYILVTNINKNEIKLYRSINSIQKELNIKWHRINNAILGGKQIDGFMFEYGEKK